jgi:glycerol-3-phosphate dehydrogenase (NAD(P)+)
MKIAVISNGSFGTCLAQVLCENNHDVTLWGRDKEYIAQMQSTRVNERYLKEFTLNKNLKLTSDIAVAVDSCDFILVSTPTQYVRSSLKMIHALNLESPLIVNVAKGIEVQSLKRVSEITQEIFGDNHHYVNLAGPSHAEELMQRIPTALVAASKSPEHAELIQKAFMNDYLRVYSSSDVTGVELGGALKNIFAIAAGIVDGMKFGDNTKAALMTRGIAEMARLGKALGGKESSFNGLSGVGDLIVTCTSQHSRNRFVGEALGKGQSMQDIHKSMGHSVAEGVKTTESAWQLAQQFNVDTPIISEAYNVLYQEANPSEALMRLMGRDAKEEWY